MNFYSFRFYSFYKLRFHSCRTVVRAARLPRFLDPRGSKIPKPINIKLNRGDYVGDLTSHANIGISTLKGEAVLHMHEVVIIHVYFFYPTVTFL